MSRRDLRPGMSRAEASSVLGVPADADADQVRRAWRTWARLAHPDLGGDREFFDRLRTARDVLLDPGADAATEADAAREPRPHPSGARRSQGPAARLPWSQVLRRPRCGELVLLGLTAVFAVALAALVLAVGPTPDPLALAVAAGPAAVAAAGWARIAVSRILTDRADVAHRITALVVAWLPLTAAQVLLAALLGTSLIAVLPMLVLPLVVVVAAINPGAGLWRPAHRRG